MDILSFLDLISYAITKEKEDKLYQMWCGMLPKFQKFMAFEEFKEKMTGANIDTRSAEEIMADIEETHRKAKERIENGS